MKILLKCFIQLFFIYQIAIISGEDLPHFQCEVSETLRDMSGELTIAQLSSDTNKCLKESLYSTNEPELIKNLFNTTKAYETIVSFPRRQASLELARAALAITNEGDFVETGLFRGGSAATLLNILLRFDNCGRKFYGFDSFEGLPQNEKEDKSKFGVILQPGKFAIPMEHVISRFKAWGVYDENRVIITKGWFNDTLPVSPVSKISFLRADGDLFVSTMDALTNLYHKIVPGGLIYIDDYGSFPGCREAVDKFRIKNHIYEPLRYVREDGIVIHIKFEAVWWQKRRHTHKNKHN